MKATTGLSRRALMLLLVAAFLQPACFTSMTWRDDRIPLRLARVEPPQLEVYGGPPRSGVDLVLRVPKSYRGLLPGVPADFEWVELRARDHRETVAALIAAGAAQEAWPDRLWIDLVEEVDGGRDVLLRAYSDGRFAGHLIVAALPGFEKRRLRYRSNWWFEVPCEVVPLTAQPAVGERLESCRLSHERMRDNGTPVLTRIALTPLALAGDVMFWPFELIWWLSL